MHLGIIMDGNRRWAKSRGLSAFEGHKKGAENIKNILKQCKKRDIKILTLYAFSTENWDRSKKEVGFLMELLGIYLADEVKELHKENIRLLFIGQREKLSVSLQEKMLVAEDLTKNNRDLTLAVAISYGGRDEIVRAVKKAILWDGVDPSQITEEKIGVRLDTAELPDPDLIIRTGGEVRISNFLIWQSAYSELYFTEKYWPDFSGDDLDAALVEYGKRQRRFGK